MVEMDEAQQAFDDGETGVGGGHTDGREDSGPAAADERVGHHGQRRRERGAERRGDTGVVGDLFGITMVIFSLRRRRRQGGRRPREVIARTERIAVDAVLDHTTGAPPSRATSVSVNRISIDVPDSGTLSSTWLLQVYLQSRASGMVCGAGLPGLVLTHLPVLWIGDAWCTGLVVMRPAHTTSGASRTTASGPVTSARS